MRHPAIKMAQLMARGLSEEAAEQYLDALRNRVRKLNAVGERACRYAYGQWDLKASNVIEGGYKLSRQ